MAKRLLGLMLIVMMSVFVTKAQESLLVYDGITPAPGSEISSFDFTLKFDLSRLIESKGDGNYGVGWVGYHNDKRPEREKSVTIFKGDPSDGVVIGRVCNTGYSGGSIGFSASSDVHISIEGAIPEPGVKYTMVINNEFKAFTVGNAVPIANAVFDCFTNPVTYTFVGGVPSDDKVAILECSVSRNQSIETLSEIVFNFNQPITVNPDFPIQVKEGDVIYSSSKDYILSEDKTSVTYKFDNVPLLLNHSYVITLPNGAVSSVGDSSETNNVFNIPVTGNYVGYFNLISSTPTPEQKSIFTTIEGVFDMPEGFQIYKKPEYALNLSALLYKEEVSEANLVGKVDGVYNAEKNGIVWTNNFALDPSSTYILYKPARDFKAYEVSTDKFSNDLQNGEMQIVLNTPSVEESGLTAMEWGEPVIGTHGTSSASVFVNDARYSYISKIEVALKDLTYNDYNGKKLSVWNDTNNAKAFLYDITDGKETLIKEIILNVSSRENATQYYSVVSGACRNYFWDGHKYKFVIPQGAFAISEPLIKNYLRTPELAIEFYGSSPAEVELINCSISENAELSEIFNVVWEFKGEFELNPDAKAKLSFVWANGIKGTEEYSLINYVNGGNTTLTALMYNVSTGGPRSLSKGAEYTLTLPAGTLYYPGDETIANKDISISFRGVEAAPEIKEPEFVNVEVNVNGFHTTTLEAVKDRKLTVSLIPDGNWKVTSLTRDGNDVLPFMEENDGVYTTPALTADTKLAATVEYDGVIINDIASDVVEIPDTSVKVYSDGEHIIVDGINAGDVVAVYSTNGLLITEQTMNVSDRAMQITIANGQIYIVRVNDKAVKIQH